MSSTQDQQRAKRDDTAHTTAHGSERTHRVPVVRALAALCAGALAAGALAAVNAASAPAPSATAASVTRAAPMLATRAHHVAKATIGLFTVTPTQLPAAGGRVRLVAVVAGATSCRFSSSKPVGHLPASRPCSSGRVSMTVTLPKNTRSSSRRFRFQVTARDGRTSTTVGPVSVTESAPITVVVAPQVTTQPTDRSVAAGSTVSFSAAASGSPSVLWQVSSDSGQNWANVSGATSNTYTFTAALADSGREYRAVFTNAAGSKRSEAAVLTVTSGGGGGGGKSNTPSGQSPSGGSPTGSPTAKAPVITQQPANVTLVSGATASFTAAASGTPAPSVQWQLSTGGAWSDIPGATSPTYSFAASQSQNGSQYRASFSNSAGSGVTTNAATLTVQTPPQVTLQPSSTTVSVGSSASFTATATGSPAPTVQWQVSTNGGATWSPVLSGGTSITYSIPSTTLAQSGSQYRAAFSNGVGAAVNSNPATLTVTGPVAPQITGQPSNRAALANTSVTFTASASGSPAPTVQWQVSTNHGGTWTMLAGATSPTLAFTAAAGDNGKEYEATFSNGVGAPVTTTAATLAVGADSTSQNWSGYAATAPAGTFTAVSGSWNVSAATCTPSTTYSSQWVGIDGDPGATSPTVEQDGTSSNCSGGVASYVAWYETYGPSNTNPPVNKGSEQDIPSSTYPVVPGDAMTGTVTVSGTSYTLALSDLTRGWNFSTGPITWTAPNRSSAEWIVERPQVNGVLASLTNFGTAGFASATATTTGSPLSISALGGKAIDMTNNATTTLLALPSPLAAGGESFTDTFYGSN